MVAERAGERFVRAGVRVPRASKDVGSPVCEPTRRLSETSRPRIAHDRQPRRSAERPHHVEARDSTDACDLVEGQRVSKMAFDKPERLLSRITGQWPSFEACTS